MQLPAGGSKYQKASFKASTTFLLDLGVVLLSFLTWQHEHRGANSTRLLLDIAHTQGDIFDSEFYAQELNTLPVM